MPSTTGRRLTRDRIEPEEVLGSVSDPGSGAVVMFFGTVRETSEAGRVDRIRYEAYGPMAEDALEKTEGEIRRAWPATKGVKIVHRVGDLAVGDISVAVAVSSPHRAEAFEACRQAIETIKHEVPIWKRERLSGGREVWVEGRPLGPPSRPERRKARRERRDDRRLRA